MAVRMAQCSEQRSSPGALQGTVSVVVKRDSLPPALIALFGLVMTEQVLYVLYTRQGVFKGQQQGCVLCETGGREGQGVHKVASKHEGVREESRGAVLYTYCIHHLHQLTPCKAAQPPTPSRKQELTQ